MLTPSTKALPTRWPHHAQNMAPCLATWTWSVIKTAFYCAAICFPCVWSKGIQNRALISLKFSLWPCHLMLTKTENHEVEKTFAKKTCHKIHAIMLLLWIYYLILPRLYFPELPATIGVPKRKLYTVSPQKNTALKKCLTLFNLC